MGTLSLFEELDNAPNIIIADSFVITNSKLKQYKNIVVSISGGYDSDILLDIISKFSTNKNIKYVFFDTGLEYQATKEHLKYLEEKYGIKIEIIKAIKPISLTCRQYGQPFLSKHVSEMIMRLQKHNFNWEDKPFEELYKEYPKCKSALEWWCNTKPSKAHNISQNKLLKEFLIAYPPRFQISNLCCKYAKKDVSKKLFSRGWYDLSITGIRKAEGGVRATAYKSCFDNNGDGYDNYRPLFWYKDSDKEEYTKHYGILHSKCYTEYGLKRTGCAGCPFGRDFEHELEIIRDYEPKLYKAVDNIFGDSYDYTRKYREFVEHKDS